MDDNGHKRDWTLWTPQLIFDKAGACDSLLNSFISLVLSKMTFCMSIRSSTRNLFPPLEDPERTIRRRTRVDPNSLNNFEEINMAANENGDDGLPPAGGGLPVPDLRTMEELF
ncbi:hypothetical protein Tco_0377508 [Tanacetum coccineum]